jgi:hypothetical protein
MLLLLLLLLLIVGLLQLQSGLRKLLVCLLLDQRALLQLALELRLLNLPGPLFLPVVVSTGDVAVGTAAATCVLTTARRCRRRRDQLLLHPFHLLVDHAERILCSPELHLERLVLLLE